MTIILLNPILGKNYENSPWKTMTTRGKKKKQEQMKNSNQHKTLENQPYSLGRNKINILFSFCKFTYENNSL